MQRSVLSVLLALVLVGCSDGPTSVANGVVKVTLEESGLRIENLSDVPRAYAAYDEGFLALADFALIALCSTPDAACLRLPAKSSVLVPFSEVGGYGSGTTTIVVWTWRVVATGAGQYNPAMDDAISLKL